MIIYTLALSNGHRHSLIKTTTEMAFSSIINKRICSACKLESCLYSQGPFYLSVADPCRVPENCIPISDQLHLGPGRMEPGLARTAEPRPGLFEGSRPSSTGQGGLVVADSGSSTESSSKEDGTSVNPADQVIRGLCEQQGWNQPSAR